MRIHDWPPPERPRERLLRAGPRALSEAELLAIWLRTGVRGGNAVELARELLSEFGSLRGLLGADRERLRRHRGIGPARCAELQAILELARRHQLETLKAGPPLTSPRLARDYLLAELRDRDYEVFCVLYLDRRHCYVAFLPLVGLRLGARRPSKIPEHPETLGEHLYARRLRLRLSRPQAATCLGVTRDTVLNWERGWVAPLPRALPAIYAFLGGDPRPPPLTLGERLRRWRESLGLTVRAAADRIGVRRPTYTQWERGGVVLRQGHRNTIAATLGIDREELERAMSAQWRASWRGVAA